MNRLVKLFGNNPKDYIIAYCPKNYDVLSLISLVQKYDKTITGAQFMENNEEINTSHVFFIQYNFDENMVLFDCLLTFDLVKSTMSINGKKTYKVVEDNEFVFKFQKTQIKAIDGCNGLIKEIVYSGIVNCLAAKFKEDLL